MLKVLLVIGFMNGPGQEPTLVDGWYPREQPSAQVCAERADYANNYLGMLRAENKLPEGFKYYGVACIEVEDGKVMI